MTPYFSQLKYFHYDIQTKTTKGKKKGEKTRYKKTCEDIFCFDIETTSAWVYNGKIIPYTPRKPNDFWNELESLSLCYIWQFSVNNEVYYGRELKDFTKVLDDLPTDVFFIIWVHNLSYEFVFLQNILTWEKVFARSPHKPMKASAIEYPNIEFRCTYMLTRLSLDAWGKQIGFRKKTGDLNYEVIRTPLTPLTKEELLYCETDCLVMFYGLQVYKKRYGSLKNIPLTQTGTVRREVKELLTANPTYVKNVKQLIPIDADEYKRLQNIFAGGYTHANRFHSGIVQIGDIEHRDFASQYPTMMFAELYPMSSWRYKGSLAEMPNDFDKSAWLFEINFRQLKSISFNTYIQGSKATCTGSKEFPIIRDNGRIVQAETLNITITEQDWLIIKENYQWKEFEIVKSWRANKRYLPTPFANYILDLYENKTKLKGVKGSEDLYMQSKQYINSLFGMMVTAILQADVHLINDEWKVDKITTEQVNAHLDKLRSWSPREKRYFLSYSWGIYVTAYARRYLWKCIHSIDEDVIYADTDSIFANGKHDWSWYDKEITSKIKKACDYHKIPFERTRPKDPKGIERPLGIFTKEDDCIEFLTLGAKRYVERRKDGKLYLTVSGINKSAVELLCDDIDNFREGFLFDKDSISPIDNEIKYSNGQRAVKKTLPKYLSNMPTVVYPDGYISTYRYGINMRRNGYELTMTDEYKDLIQYQQIDVGSLPQSTINKLRGGF